MKILMASNAFPASDKDWTASFAYFLALELKKRGHDVSVVTLEREVNWVDDGKIEVHRIPARGCLGKDEGISLATPSQMISFLGMMMRASGKINELCKSGQFDVGFAVWATPSGNWLSKAKKRYSLPYITWSLGSDIWRVGRIPVIRNIVKKSLILADFRFADGFDLVQEVQELCGLSCAFLPSARKLPAPISFKDKNIDDKKVFLYIGRWEPVKGVDVLIKAFAQAKIANAVLLIFGLGSQGSIYQQLISSLKAEGQIFLNGYADPQTAANYLARSHCCVIPSRNESIPIILSDALQLHCPIVATEVGDMGRIIQKYRIGMSVPADNVDALAAALKEMAQLERSAFQPGIQKALEIFDVSNIAKVWEAEAMRIVGKKNNKNL